jgi:hypothetical protein
VTGPGPSAPASEITVPARIFERALRLAEELGEDLESVLYYEHPFTGCGLVVVVSGQPGSYLDRVARVHRTLLGAARVHCLWRRELFQLALPGSGPPFMDDQPHLAHCVRYRSVLLHGRDFRPEVPLPTDPGLFLRAHLRDYRHYLRVHFLKLLVARDDRKLVGEALVEARRLLFTALLGEGGWQLAPKDVTERFAEGRPGEAAAVAKSLEALAARQADGPETGREEEAREAFWLLERLARLLEGAAR